MVEFVASSSRHGGGALVLATWPIGRPPDWVERVNRPDYKRAGVAPPKRAPRVPVWSAGVAKADRETIGPGAGLSSKWSTAEDRPFGIQSVDRLESGPRN